MNRLKIIETASEHQQALVRLMELMDLDPDDGTPKADELALLALLIEHYERVHYPIEPPTPIETIRFRMDQIGLNRKDLARYIGSVFQGLRSPRRQTPLEPEHDPQAQCRFRHIRGYPDT